MVRNINTIDTDQGIGTILSNFDSQYIYHVISDSLNMKFRPFDGPMPNMVDILERQFNSILSHSPDYINQVKEVRFQTYKEIIITICNYYNLTFSADVDNLSQDELFGITRLLYEIFVARFTDYMIDFFVSYIVNNADSIVSYLNIDENSIKPKESGSYSPKYYIDPKFIIIHANANKVIYNLAAYDITLENLFNYFVDNITASRLNNIISDNGDIYKNHYASYILDSRYTANILTIIKLRLQARTRESINVLG